MQKGDLVIVRAPRKYANSQLNNTYARITYAGNGISEVVLLTGKDAGRHWFFNNEHIRHANRRANKTCTRTKAGILKARALSSASRFCR